MKTEKKIGRADYRMCKVKEVERDEKGLVRTVQILMRPRDSREKSLPYKAYKEDELDKKPMAVQKLVMLCPSEEVEKLEKMEREKELLKAPESLP